MARKGFLVLAILCAIASIDGISSLARGIMQRGFGGVNYGVLIPLPIGIRSFFRWKKAKP